MIVVKKILNNELFKVVSVNLFLQFSKGIVCFNVNPWQLVIIEPAVINLKAIQKSLWKSSKISFSILKLIIVKSGHQSFLVNAILNLLFKNFNDSFYKFVLLRTVSIFGNY